MRIFALFFSLFFLSLQSYAQDKIIDLSAIDEKVDPCSDFYRYACGTWLDKTNIPGDKQSVSRTMSGLFDSTELSLNKMIQAQDKNSRLNIYYTSCMNPDPKKGKEFFLRKFNQLQSLLKTPLDLALFLSNMHQEGSNAFFGFGAMPDPKDSSKMIGAFSQAGLSLPEKDYYLRTDKKSQDILKKYRQHIADMFHLLGFTTAQSVVISYKILKLETEMAKYSYDLGDSTDPLKTYYPITLSDFKKEFKSLPWDIYFKGIKAPALSKMNILHINFLRELDKTLADKSHMSSFKYYLLWHMLLPSAESMGGDFSKAYFDFWGKSLRGKTESSPRWKTCTRLTEKAIGDDLGKIFVKENSGDEIRLEAKKMTEIIKESFGKNLSTLDWLDEKTREAAYLKLSQITSKIAYPEKWINYESLKFDPKDALGNLYKANTFSFQKDILEIGQNKDLKKWQMNPWEINAYYDPTYNEFVFPLGILLPPMFDLKASIGANYGSFGGGTVGHELTHGFDDQGRQYDGLGNLNEWWTADVSKKFDEKAQCFSDQADKYEILPGLFVNGKNTLGENLADQGGLKIAYMALQVALNKAQADANTNATSQLGKYNQNQQFFLSYAQSWCEKIRPEALRTQVTSDEHPPAEFRVNSIVRNMPEFSQAFSCPVGTQLNPRPENKCALW